jgi:hypothetical protein
VPELVPVIENIPVILPNSEEESVNPVLPEDVCETVTDNISRVEAVGVAVKKEEVDWSLLSEGECEAERDMTAVTDLYDEVL